MRTLIDDVIDEALKHTYHSSGNRSVLFVRSRDDLYAEMDASLISQVIINLVNNALKYTPDGSVIKVETEEISAPGKEIAVSVSDNGDGVSEEELPNLFTLFYTGQKKAPDSRRGLGLGLAVCRSIVEAHGGKICAENLIPHGLRIWFTLPEKEIILNGDVEDISGRR